MIIKLKDLRRIESELNKEFDIRARRVREIDLPVTDSLSDAASNGLSWVNANLEKMKAFIDAKYRIREIISQFNVTNAINGRTLEIAKSSELLKLVEDTNDMRIPSRAYDYHTSTYSGYNCGLSTEGKDTLRVEARSLRRDIQALKDSCAGINANNTVELPTSLVEFLTENNLI